jgi:hypothetical protein
MAYTGFSLKEIGNRFRSGIDSSAEVDAKVQEAKDGAYGELEDKTFHLDLVNGINYHKGKGSIEITRATKKWAKDSYGRLVEYKENDLAFEEGVGLIENTKENHCPYGVTGGFDETNFPREEIAGTIDDSGEVFTIENSDLVVKKIEYTEDTTFAAHYNKPFKNTDVITTTVGAEITYSVFLQDKATGAKRYPKLWGYFGNDGTVRYLGVVADLSTGEITFATSGNMNYVAHGIEKYSDGVYRLWVKGTVVGAELDGTPTNLNTAAGQLRWDETSGSITNFQGDGVSGGYHFLPQVELGDLSSPIITTDSLTRQRDYDDIRNYNRYENLNLTKPFSVSTKVKSINYANGSNNMIIQTSSSSDFYLNINSPGEPVFRVYGAICDSNYPLESGIEYKITATFDTALLSLYINGNLIASASFVDGTDDSTSMLRLFAQGVNGSVNGTSEYLIIRPRCLSPQAVALQDGGN